MNAIEKLNANKKTTITEKELQSLIGSWDYECFAKEVGEMVRKNVVRPVKSKQSGMNGRIPPLYNKYRIVRIENDYAETLEEIKLLNPRLNIGGYLENPVLYGKHRRIIGKLSEYLWSQGELLHYLPIRILGWWKRKISNRVVAYYRVRTSRLEQQS